MHSIRLASLPILAIAFATAALLGCSGTRSVEEPSAPPRDVACAESGGAPTGYVVAIDGARTTLKPSPPLAIIATAKDAPPYSVELRADVCGSRARLAYTVTRLATPDDAYGLMAALGPPPGLPSLPEAPPRITPAQRLEGKRDVVRGEEVVIGEGAWPDGAPYRVSVIVQ